MLAPLGRRVPLVISRKFLAGDLGRIGFLREPEDGESPRSWRWELAGAGSAVIDLQVPAAVHRSSTVSMYHSDYVRTIIVSYKCNVVSRTQPASLRENDQSSTVTENVIPLVRTGSRSRAI